MEDEKNNQAVELAKLIFDPTDPIDYLSLFGGPGLKTARTAYKINRLPPNVRAKMPTFLGGGGGGQSLKGGDRLKLMIEKNKRLYAKLDGDLKKEFDYLEKQIEEIPKIIENLPSPQITGPASLRRVAQSQFRRNELYDQLRDFVARKKEILRSVDDELPLQFGGPVSPLLYGFK